MGFLTSSILLMKVACDMSTEASESFFRISLASSLLSLLFVMCPLHFFYFASCSWQLFLSPARNYVKGENIILCNIKCNTGAVSWSNITAIVKTSNWCFQFRTFIEPSGVCVCVYIKKHARAKNVLNFFHKKNRWDLCGKFLRYLQQLIMEHCLDRNAGYV